MELKNQRIEKSTIGSSLINATKSFIATINYFLIFCLCFPFFILCFLAQSVTDKLWSSWLLQLYPHLSFSRVNNFRSSLDSPRNPGVLHFLIKVKGQCDGDLVKTKLLNTILCRTNKFGNGDFGTLKSTLTTCWGKFAWNRNTTSRNFDINNHVFVLPSLYHGRPINEKNIQECASEIISKYMSPDHPQWQIHLIQLAKTDTYFMLIRIHHLIIDEEPNIFISDLLLLTCTTKPCQKSQESLQLAIKSQLPFNSQLDSFGCISKLYSRISLGLTNRWNEFIYRYDPLESPDYEKNVFQGLWHLYSIIIIVIVTIISDFIKGFNATQNNLVVKLRFFKNLVRREIIKRNLSIPTMWQATLASLNPLNFVQIYCKCMWILISTTIKTPFYVYREYLAIKSLITLRHCGYHKSATSLFYEYTPLIYGAAKEMLMATIMLIAAPKKIVDEIFMDDNQPEHYLQNISLCGRKVVSWSESIQHEKIAKFAEETGYTEFEIILSAISYALERQNLRPYDEVDRHKRVKSIRTTIRSIPCENIFDKTKLPNSLWSFNLTLQPGAANKLVNIRQSLYEAGRNQPMRRILYGAQHYFGYLAKCLPCFWTRVLLKYLTKRFAVTITEIRGEVNGLDKNFVTIWGEPVDDIIYFQPPQANIILSLTILRVSDTIRLGVIADAEISPNHINISNNFVKYFNEHLF